MSPVTVLQKEPPFLTNVVSCSPNIRFVGSKDIPPVPASGHVLFFSQRLDAPEGPPRHGPVLPLQSRHRRSRHCIQQYFVAGYWMCQWFLIEDCVVTIVWCFAIASPVGHWGIGALI